MSRDRPPMKRAVAVGQLLEGLLRAKGMEDKVARYRVWLAWDRAVGPQIAAQARPVRIRENTLEIRVASPVWMQQLQLLKPRILAKLNDALGEQAFTDIYLRRGKVEKRDAPAPKQPTWRDASLDADEQAQIEQTLADISDPDLRGAMRRVLERQKRLEKIQKEA